MKTHNRKHSTTFFTKEWPSQDQCDGYAIFAFPDSGSIQRNFRQGANSYTVKRDTSIVQFRKKKLARDKIDLAAAPYKGHVPRVEQESRFGNFWVYKRALLSGITLDCRLLSCKTVEDRFATSYQTMESLAKFHASSILKKQADQPAPRAGLLEYCRNALFAIGLRLPGETWLLTINYLCANVHQLFEKDWPMVVSNVWVTPSNVVVDEDGVFQGCLEWEDTEVFPFGIAVATTHRFLGEFKTTSHKDIAVQKWTPVEGSQQLKWHFLKTLQTSLDGESNVMWDERLAIAEMVGVILDRSCGYGKILEENDYPIVFDDDYRMSFLDQHIWGSGDSIADWMGRRFINAEGKLVDESLDLTDLDMVWDY